MHGVGEYPAGIVTLHRYKRAEKIAGPVDGVNAPGSGRPVKDEVISLQNGIRRGEHTQRVGRIQSGNIDFFNRIDAVGRQCGRVGIGCAAEVESFPTVWSSIVLMPLAASADGLALVAPPK